MLVPASGGHAFNPQHQEAEEGGFLSLRTVWSTKSFRTHRATQRNFVPEKPKCVSAEDSKALAFMLSRDRWVPWASRPGQLP